MSDKHRIGILGGTFDPIHNTHLAIAQTAFKEASLDKVLFLVAASPPHKKGMIATPEQRYAMVQAAVQNEPAFEASDIEINREGPSYTAVTLRELKNLYPDSEFFLIMGLDSLIDFPNWREPDTILSLATILAVTRPGNGSELPGSLDGHYRLLPFSESEVSSTAVRLKVRQGGDLKNVLPPAVSDIIKKEGIYLA
jgi:nicotinate-nucleotide adenylyltransferase